MVGKLRLQFAVMSLARTLGLSIGPVRQAVRRLDELGALRVLERSMTGHLVEMRLPGQKWRLNGCGGCGGRRGGACLDTRNHGFLENLGAHAYASDAIPSATWFPAVSNATRAGATVRSRIFCALSTAWVA
ncbi:MAG: hypothetical protein AUH16_01190 [Acidobacteria bacterium 13_2_20CM_57_7]|nr:MAG: hypothetical protein AUH16_01190 [Acidobacteria bacterium 13_2_20CM_57_7]